MSDENKIAKGESGKMMLKLLNSILATSKPVVRFKILDPELVTIREKLNSLDEAGHDTNSIDNKEVLNQQRKRRSKMRTGLERDESIRKEVVGVRYIRAEGSLNRIILSSSLRRLVCYQEDWSQKKLQSPCLVLWRQ